MLGILIALAEVRADAIGRLHARDDGVDLTELLIELEEKEWTRQWFVERLSAVDWRGQGPPVIVTKRVRMSPVHLPWSGRSIEFLLKDPEVTEVTCVK